MAGHQDPDFYAGVKREPAEPTPQQAETPVVPVAAGDAELIAEHEWKLAAFADGLNQLHIDCGAPPHSTISKNARKSNRYPLPASSLSEVFAGKRLPKLDFLIELIRQLSPDDLQLREEWRSRWATVKQAERRALLIRKRQEVSPATLPVLPALSLAPPEEPDERLAIAEERARVAEERAKKAEQRAEAAEERAKKIEEAEYQASPRTGKDHETDLSRAVEAIYSLGRLYETNGQFDRAEEVYVRALDHGHSDAAYSLGNLYETNGQFDRAEEMYVRALDHGHSDAAYSLGNLYEQTGRLDRAKDMYNHALYDGGQR
ncbi:tetratricopeptide repeat protein [Streptomyces sp. NPDC056723]|uniref:tetratricopeptide repeat protein n=1 Tax=Streptomyces sp. NPDC056723 TaxID=3345925 RepID=UPI0036BE5B3B